LLSATYIGKEHIMDSELIKIVRIINSISQIYWRENQTQTNIRSLAEERNWREALEWFLNSYAFERAGRSPHYAKTALESVRLYDGKIPAQDFETEVWNKFLSVGEFPANGKGANIKNNPLAPSGNGYMSVSSFITTLEAYQFNIVRWASSLVRAGNIKGAWDELKMIRGIGSKIASFFLRDLVYALEINEDTVGRKVYLQPIDIWTERGAGSLAYFLSRDPKSDDECAEVIIEVSELAGVPSTLINTGLWILGAQIVQNEVKFKELLQNHENLRKFLSDQVISQRKRADEIENILKI